MDVQIDLSLEGMTLCTWERKDFVKFAIAYPSHASTKPEALGLSREYQR
ncbi:MAG TPA: hypothetical protein V6C91_08445 [Coleofasciculaceae cyanobacterium]